MPTPGALLYSLVETAPACRLSRVVGGGQGSGVPFDEIHPLLKTGGGLSNLGGQLQTAARHLPPDDPDHQFTHAALRGDWAALAAVLDHLAEGGQIDQEVQKRYNFILRGLQLGRHADWLDDKYNQVHKRVDDSGGGYRITRPRKPKQLARTNPPTVHAIYVSPSQREWSTFADAVKGLRSPEMQRLESSTPNGQTGLGVWRDGAEETRFVRSKDPARLRLHAALLGRRYNQKAVMTFAETPHGEDTLHLIRVAERDPRAIHDTMMKYGVGYKTIVPVKGGSVVHVVDFDDSQRDAIQKFVTDSGATGREVRGNAEIIGADDREGARRVFEDVLRSRTVKLARVSPGEMRGLAEHAPDIAIQDALEQAGDPRKELTPDITHLRNQFHDFDDKAHEIALGRPITDTDKPVLWRTGWLNHNLPPGYNWRHPRSVINLSTGVQIRVSTRPVRLNDGGLLNVRTFTGPAGRAYHVEWHPTAKGAFQTGARLYRGVFNHDEFRDWLRRFRERTPVRLARMNPDDVWAHMVHPEFAQDRTPQLILADRMQEAGDPREDLLRAGLTDRTEARRRAISIARGVPEHRGGYEFHPGVLDADYGVEARGLQPLHTRSRHGIWRQLPDGSEWTVTRLRGKAGTAYHVEWWTPGGASFNAAMTTPEFADWVKKFKPGGRTRSRLARTDPAIVRGLVDPLHEMPNNTSFQETNLHAILADAMQEAGDPREQFLRQHVETPNKTYKTAVRHVIRLLGGLPAETRFFESYHPFNDGTSLEAIRHRAGKKTAWVLTLTSRGPKKWARLAASKAFSPAELAKFVNGFEGKDKKELAKWILALHRAP